MNKEELIEKQQALLKELEAVTTEINNPNNNPSAEEWFKELIQDIKPRIDDNSNIDWVNSKGEWVFYDKKII